MTDSLLESEYTKVKRSCYSDCKSKGAGDAIIELVMVSLRFLVEQCESVRLISRVPKRTTFPLRRMVLLRGQRMNSFSLQTLTKFKNYGGNGLRTKSIRTISQG